MPSAVREELSSVAHPFVVCHKACHLILPDTQIWEKEQGLAHICHIGLSVHLAAGGPYGRPLAHIEDAHLYGRSVCPKAHHAAKGVDFPHHVGLGKAAYGRIAGKMP